MTRCDDCEYSFSCYDCEHCFGCIGLRHKKFHIFNKEYSEQEYWKKVDEIKCAMLERGEYGRPIPPAFSTSYYPESGCVLYLGASMGDWNTIGLPRFEIDADGAFGEMRTEGKEVLASEQAPSHVDELDDSWAGRVIMDEEIKRPFTYLKPEIAFYKKHGIAPARKHFTTRMRNLFRAMNTGLFEERACHACEKEITIAVNKKFLNRKVYCMECYLKYLEEKG